MSAKCLYCKVIFFLLLIMYFVRGFLELCKFPHQTFTSLELLYSIPWCVPTEMASSPLPDSSALRAQPPNTSQGHPPACILSSPCLWSDSGRWAAATTHSMWRPSSPPLGLGFTDQAVLTCICPSHRAAALTATLGCPLQGCHSCFSWALRPWAGLRALGDAPALLRLCHLASGHFPL